MPARRLAAWVRAAIPPAPPERGASLVEYALLLALILLVCVLALDVLGNSTGESLSRSGSSIFRP